MSDEPRYAVYAVAIEDTEEAHERLLDGSPFVLAWDRLRSDLDEAGAVDAVEHRAIVVD